MNNKGTKSYTGSVLFAMLLVISCIAFSIAAYVAVARYYGGLDPNSDSAHLMGVIALGVVLVYLGCTGLVYNIFSSLPRLMLIADAVVGIFPTYFLFGPINELVFSPLESNINLSVFERQMLGILPFLRISFFIFTAVFIFYLISALIYIVYFFISEKEHEGRKQLSRTLHGILNSRFAVGIEKIKPPAFVLLSVFLLTYFAAQRLYLEGMSDSWYHTGWALEFSPSNLSVKYFLWHIFVKAVYAFDIFSASQASSIVTALFNTLSCYIIYRVFLDTGCRKLYCELFALASMLVFPLYRTNITPNPWFSSTTLAVKPFAILAFYMFVTIYERYKSTDGKEKYKFKSKVYTRAELFAFPTVIFLGCLAKPVFIQVFVPALAVFLIIDLALTRFKAFWFCFKTALAFVPSAVLVLIQAYFMYGGGSQFEEAPHMEIAFLRYDGGLGFVNTVVYLLHILLTVAFPLFVSVILVKNPFKDTKTCLAWLSLMFGVLEHMFLTEVGREVPGDNFVWGKITGYVLVWIVSLDSFMRFVRKRKGGKGERVKLVIGCTLLGAHLFMGITYLPWLYNTTFTFFSPVVIG